MVLYSLHSAVLEQHRSTRVAGLGAVPCACTCVCVCMCVHAHACAHTSPQCPAGTMLSGGESRALWRHPQGFGCALQTHWKSHICTALCPGFLQEAFSSPCLVPDHAGRAVIRGCCLFSLSGWLKPARFILPRSRGANFHP